MSPRTQKAIDIFLDALNEGTLSIGNCGACALGNLLKVAIQENYPYITTGKTNEIQISEGPYKGFNNSGWSKLFMTQHRMDNIFYQNSFPFIGQFYCGLPQAEIRKILSELLPFSEKELMQIEYTFESANDKHIERGGTREEQIKALAAVVNLMLSWDETPEKVEEVFTSKAELIPA